MALLAVVIAGACAVALWPGRGRPDAPAASDLALARGMHRVAVADDWGFDNRRRFRDIAIAGSLGETLSQATRREVRLLEREGWTYASTATFVGVPPTPSSQPRRVAIGTPSSDTILNNHTLHIYAAITPVATWATYEDATDGEAIFGARTVASAFATHRPIMVATLGNGTNSGSG